MKKKCRENRKKKNGRRRNEFTFVETLAVLAAGVVLTAGVGVSSVRLVEVGRKTVVKNSIDQFKSALQSYYIDCGQFPTTQQGLEALCQKPVLVPVPQNWKGPYLDHELQSDPWGKEYVYATKNAAFFPEDAASGVPFVIVCYGADGVTGGEGSDADILSWK